MIRAWEPGEAVREFSMTSDLPPRWTTRKRSLAALALSTLPVSSALAMDLLPPSSVHPLPTNTYLNVTYDNADATGTLSVDLLGFGSLDGDNFYRDQFVLLLNGGPVFAGSFAMGGGGASTVDFNPHGATVHTVQNGTPIFDGATYQGGSTGVVIPGLNLRQADVLTLGYSSLTAPYFGFQGLDDESWSVSSLHFAVSPVPEAGSAGTWLAGLALLGWCVKRLRAA